MSKSVGLSLIAAVLIGIWAVPAPHGTRGDAPQFWQLHGAAPAAVETATVTQLRLAAQAPVEPAAAPIVLAMESVR